MIIQHLRSAALLGEGADLTDAQLLERFVSCREQAALEALVCRHGPMVWGVCRRILQQHQDAEDAFQATFLVLVRKAASIVPREMVGNWLYGVARQTALKARATTAKRWTRERQRTEMPEPAVTEKDLWPGLQPLLDQELSLLPDKYRAVIVLCDLESKTRQEAARHLGCPEGTVASRLARARTMLGKRLARRGLAVSGGAFAVGLSQVSACVPTSVESSTIRAATLLAAGNSPVGVISGKVITLMEGVLKTMFLTKLKSVTAVLLLLMLFATGSGLLVVAGTADKKKPQPPAVEAPEKNVVQSAADALCAAYEENDASADERFTDKQVEVTGQVRHIRRVVISGSTNFGRVYVVNVMTGTNLPLWFQFDPKDRKQLAALKPQMLVTIRGQCKGRSTILADGKPEQVLLFIGCEIVDPKAVITVPFKDG
jgi:RNA polymerase sigma factor (sigma-70 family)